MVKDVIKNSIKQETYFKPRQKKILMTWYNTILKNNNAIGLDIQFDFDFFDKFGFEVFNYKLRQGFKFLLDRDGPYLFHCNAVIDRTGFVAAIIELLFGANIDDVIYDYLLSY